ncbi:MAG: phenylalanine--tRNA ligase subunit beta, partial [Polymorphobacter sp.]
LVRALCGGTASEISRAGAPPLAARTVAYRPATVMGLAGIDVAVDAQAAILTRLGFTVTTGDVWQIGVPTWRRDIGSGASPASELAWDGEADIVEEVVRIHGSVHVPSTPLPRAPGVAKPTATPQQLLERRTRRAMAARGLNEAVTWSFLPPATAALFGGSDWTLENPISADLAAMRPSLLAGLAAAAKRNADRGAASVRLFELGRRYLEDGEHLAAALLLAGEKRGRDWQTGAAAGFDAYDAKAEALAALAAAGAPVDRLMVLPPVDAWYHPGRSGRLGLGPKAVLASFGELHPRVAAGLDLKGVVAVAELYLDAIPLPKAPRRSRGAFAPPALQPVKRDFAFLVAADTPADALLRAVRGADKGAITDARLFDRFTGVGVPEGQVSLALTVTLQPGAASFTDAEIEALSARIITAAGKAVGAVLRG